MKHIIMVGLVSLALVMSGGSAMALSFADAGGATVDVGGVDVLVAGAYLSNSGEDTEINWVNEVLGLTGNAAYTSFVKDEDFENTSYDAWQDLGAGVWAYEFESDPAPAYFLIKTGNIKETECEHFLFENVEGFDWAVLALGDMHITDITNIDKVSHISEFATPVPEPATMFLFGTGLIGLVGVSRRKKK